MSIIDHLADIDWRSVPSAGEYHSYANLMYEIKPEEIFSGLFYYGMFNEKLPPMFTTEMLKKLNNGNFDARKNDPRNYIKCFVFKNKYNITGINIRRELAIPHPLAYYHLCKLIEEKWEEIQEYFFEKTKKESHKVSRIHIRRKKDTKRLFHMNYKNFNKDEALDTKLAIGKKYKVHLDIAQCFPSMYTHAIDWAMTGKIEAKKDQKDKKRLGYRLDFRTRNTKNGETNGILVAGDCYSIISEIILVAIDHKMVKENYKYYRNIDDYIYYAETYEDAEKFVRDLAYILNQYNLKLNDKKTTILPLPQANMEYWTEQLKAFGHAKIKNTDSQKDEQKIFHYTDLNRYMNLAISLCNETKNIAVINYAIKTVSSYYLGKKAKEYYLQQIHHFILLYPYLIPILDEYVIQPFYYIESELELDYNFNSEIHKMLEDIIKQGIQNQNDSTISHVLYLAIKYGLEIKNEVLKIHEYLKFNTDNDCILLTVLYKYTEVFKNPSYSRLKGYLYSYAKQKIENNQEDEYWLFVYEILRKRRKVAFNDNFLNILRKNDISFFKELKETPPCHTT